MNGCLFKTLLIFALIAAFFLGYPYLKQYASDSVQSKISTWETQGTILRKISKQVINQQIEKNNQKNDNTKN